MLSRRSTFPILVSLFCAPALLMSCGGKGSGTPTSTPTTQSITVTVSPQGAKLAPSGTQQFTATVSGTSNTGVTWSVPAGSGTVSSTGLYTAPGTPPSPSDFNVTATSVADATKSGTALITVEVHHDNQNAQTPPIELGTSGGNSTDQTTTTVNGRQQTQCCSGTLGSLISRGGTFYILSNNHVLDKSDQGVPNDPIGQPGLAESNCGTQPVPITVAHMSQAAPLKGGSVDAAMAQIVSGMVNTNGTILDLNSVGQPAPPSATPAVAQLNEPVAKSGDATGLTCSSVNSISTTVTVDYQTSCGGTTTFPVTFTNQISIAGATFSNNGDSGSLVVDSTNARPIGLLYAGNPQGTVANPIGDVLTALKDPTSGEIPVIVGGADHAVTCPPAGQSQIAAQEKTQVRPSLSSAALAHAIVVKDKRQYQLMQDPAVGSVRVGQSEDNPSQAALVVHLNSQPRLPIPRVLDGVRTRVVSDQEQAAALLPKITAAQIQSVIAIKEQHVKALMSNPAIFAVGVGASHDNPAEPAIVIYAEQGKQVSIPEQIDGVRTRVIVSERFRAFNWGTRTKNVCSSPVINSTKKLGRLTY
ncbi:MAG TPA: hypothetical protein VFQ00_06175 [Terriglobales bacterium]|nr:hypothetical protein [Terriglobales bacterium]